MAKRIRCYLGLHRFVRRKNDDGQVFKECRDCGKSPEPGGRAWPLGS